MTQPLTDAELDRILEAAWALHPSQRGAFEQQVIMELQRLPPDTRGPGSLHRVIAACQRNYIGSSAIAVGAGNQSHYDRPSALRDKGK